MPSPSCFNDKFYFNIYIYIVYCSTLMNALPTPRLLWATSLPLDRCKRAKRFRTAAGCELKHERLGSARI